MGKALIVMAMLAAAIGTSAQENKKGKIVETEFSFTRQGGLASNQYAIWIEDASGRYVKTIYATRFTAAKGWKTRPEALPEWTKASGISSMEKKLVDAVSGATPKTGRRKYAWDFTDDHDRKVPAGSYLLKIEGSTRWSNRIRYSARIETGGEPVVETTTIGNNEKENAMLKDVRITLVDAD